MIYDKEKHEHQEPRPKKKDYEMIYIYSKGNVLWAGEDKSELVEWAKANIDFAQGGARESLTEKNVVRKFDQETSNFVEVSQDEALYDEAMEFWRKERKEKEDLYVSDLYDEHKGGTLGLNIDGFNVLYQEAYKNGKSEGHHSIENHLEGLHILFSDYERTKINTGVA